MPLTILLLTGCLYEETPNGRFATVNLNLPTQSTTHKTVTVNAPVGTTVILQETSPTIIYRDHYRTNVHCYFENYYDNTFRRSIRRQVCL